MYPNPDHIASCQRNSHKERNRSKAQQMSQSASFSKSSSQPGKMNRILNNLLLTPNNIAFLFYLCLLHWHHYQQIYTWMTFRWDISHVIIIKGTYTNENVNENKENTCMRQQLQKLTSVHVYVVVYMTDPNKLTQPYIPFC